MEIVITLLIGTLGGLLAKKCRIPAPFMIGSMLAVGIVSISFGYVISEKSLKTFAQIVSGVYIGQTISRSDIVNFPKLWKAVGGLMAIFTLNMVMLGLVFIHYFHMDPITAFLSCLPGGIMDVSLMAVDMGARADIVASLQSARLISILLILPVWVKFWVSRSKQSQLSGEEVRKNDVKPIREKLSLQRQLQNNALILTVAVCSGLIGLWTGIPVGALIFSLVGSSILKMVKNTTQLSSGIRYAAQVVAGTIIGTNFTPESFENIQQLIVPVILLLSSYLFINLFYGWLLYRSNVLDLQSALFATSPAGATDISLLAGDLGGDMAKIAGIQISRILYTVIIMPQLVRILLSFM